MYDEEELIIFKEYENECIEFKNKLGSEKNWVIYNHNLKIGDKIYVEYLPCSQKYLYTHTPECGTVVEINENEILILNHKNIKINLEKGHLGWYSKAYDMIIYKLENN